MKTSMNQSNDDKELKFSGALATVTLDGTARLMRTEFAALVAAADLRLVKYVQWQVRVAAARFAGDGQDSADATDYILVARDDSDIWNLDTFLSSNWTTDAGSPTITIQFLTR